MVVLVALMEITVKEVPMEIMALEVIWYKW